MPVRRERLLEEFQQTLALVVDEQSLYFTVLHRLEELFACERLALLLLEADLNLFRAVAARGFPGGPGGISFRSSDRLISWLRVNEIPLAVDPASGVFRFLGEEERQTLLRLDVKLCVPLVAMNRIIGLLLLGSRRGGVYSEADLALLRALAAQAALAFENANLFNLQKERWRRMYWAERLATAGQLASGVAHEIRNPLTSVRSTIQFLLQDFRGDPAKRELLEEVVQEVDRINQVITHLLSFARAPELKIAPVAIAGVLESSLSLVAAQARLQGVKVATEIEKAPDVNGDEAQLRQLFLNIFLNAIQAMPQGGELRATLKPADGAVQVGIVDTGCGMSEEVLEKIFDPFFTTKPDGTGLGLSVSYAIVERHRGEITVRSAPGKGTTFILKFPVR